MFLTSLTAVPVPSVATAHLSRGTFCSNPKPDPSLQLPWPPTASKQRLLICRLQAQPSPQTPVMSAKDTCADKIRFVTLSQSDLLKKQEWCFSTDDVIERLKLGCQSYEAASSFVQVSRDFSKSFWPRGSAALIPRLNHQSPALQCCSAVPGVQGLMAKTAFSLGSVLCSLGRGKLCSLLRKL